MGAPPFAEVQARVAAMLRGRVLIGHGVHNDLRALQLSHPPERTIDTAALEWGPGRALNLKALSLDVLGKAIQRGGHSPHEDALASMQLFKVHRIAAGDLAGIVPSRPVSCRLCSIEAPAPPGCVVEAAHDETSTPVATLGCGSGSSGSSGGRSRRHDGAYDDAHDGACDWVLTLSWSGSAVRELLRWYADSAHADPAGTARAPLRFTPSLAKEHREQLHKEAKRVGLNTLSQGIGAARAIRVLPRGMAPPQPTAATRRLAALVYRLARHAAQQNLEGEAAPLPYSLGEVTEMVECEGSEQLPRDLEPLVAVARSALGTLPKPNEGEALARQILQQYERCLVLQGRLDGGRNVGAGGSAAAFKGGRKDWRNKTRRK